PAFRLGYIWTRYLETEFTYDRNHTTGDYELHAYETSSGADITDVEGQVSAMFTTYQFAALIHPVGNRTWKWQPFAESGVGWIDVDFTPSEEIKAVVSSPVVAEQFSVDFPRGDYGFLVTYGAGLKYFLKDEVAVRGEWRTKKYDLFGSARTDREITIGIS